MRRVQMFTRLRPKSIDRLDALAAKTGQSRSEVVRHLLAQADAKIKEAEDE